MEPSTKDEYENKIGELEVQIEDMEQSNSIHFGLILALLSYTQWHNWFYVLLIGVIVAFH